MRVIGKKRRKSGKAGERERKRARKYCIVQCCQLVAHFALITACLADGRKIEREAYLL